MRTMNDVMQALSRVFDLEGNGTKISLCEVRDGQGADLPVAHFSFVIKIEVPSERWRPRVLSA